MWSTWATPTTTRRERAETKAIAQAALLSTIAWIAACLPCSVGHAAPTALKPNIVLIMAEDEYDAPAGEHRKATQDATECKICEALREFRLVGGDSVGD